MKVSSITMAGFTRHEDTTIMLPVAGVVLVTGANGSGKSSLPEAVSMCGWGKTLRGTNPWSGKASLLDMLAGNGTRVIRKRVGKTIELSFAAANDAATKYDTPTKAQEALERVIGAHSTWARSHVFSSSDADTFTCATDGERKRMLESVLGLERFDAALDACRADIRVAKDQLATTSREQAVLAERLRGLRERLEESEEDAEAPAASEELSVADATAALAKAREAARLARDAAQACSVANNEGASPRTLPRSDECPTCGQAVGASLRKTVAAENERLAKKEKASQAALAPKLLAHQKAQAKAEAALEAAREALARARGAEAQEARHRAASARVRAHRGALEDALDEQGELNDTAALQESKLAALRQVEQVLGLRGVRAQLLGQSLSGIEEIANVWLGRIAATGDTELRLRLTPCTEKAGGGTREAIALAIEGAGGGYGYKAASGGERRRIDVALLLALAEVTAAAHGQSRGTLFFDEAFDALDEDGVVAVCEAIEELAQDTCVVVISHHPGIMQRLKCAKHIHMCQGKAEER